MTVDILLIFGLLILTVLLLIGIALSLYKPTMFFINLPFLVILSIAHVDTTHELIATLKASTAPSVLDEDYKNKDSVKPSMDFVKAVFKACMVAYYMNLPEQCPQYGMSIKYGMTNYKIVFREEENLKLFLKLLLHLRTGWERQEGNIYYNKEYHVKAYIVKEGENPAIEFVAIAPVSKTE